MRSILKDVGLDEVRLNMIKPIVDTCRECRAWERPGTSTLPSVSMPSSFNQEVECDLFFYKKHIVFHIIDRCIRYSNGTDIPNKTKDTLLEAYWDTWARHGPAKVLYCDGEGGLNNDDAKAQLNSMGTELRVRASGQHANVIEARNGLLRGILHVMEEDFKRHDIPIVFKRLLGEGIFACNAFTFYNGMSRYNACTGRQPQMLPDF